MINIIICIAVVLLILTVNEIYFRKVKVHSELSRKAVHILVGSFVAFWPYLISYQSIQLLSLAFFITVIISMKFKVFQSIHNVTRPTAGEIYFAISVGMTTLITPSHLIYTIALLHMSLADGLAAIVGTKLGKGSQYKVGANKKSLIGSSTFLFVSLLMLVIYSTLSGHSFNGWLIALALGETILENVAQHGLDNLLIPLTVAMALSL